MAIDYDHVVAVVITSHETTIAEAAKQHNVDASTVQRYRNLVKQTPELQIKFIAAWNTQRAGWASKLGAARDRMLQRLLDMTLEPNANIKDVTAAFKAISESFTSDAIMLEGGEQEAINRVGSNHQSAKTPRPAAPVRTSSEGEKPILTTGTRTTQ